MTNINQPQQQSWEKPVPEIPAWEGLSLMELLQLKQMCSDFPEDKEYVEKLTKYINEVAKYEQNRR